MVTEAPSPLPASPLPGSETTSEYHPLCSIPTHTHFSFSVIGLSCCLFVCFVFKQGRERFGYPNPSPWGSSLKAVGMNEGGPAAFFLRVECFPERAGGSRLAGLSQEVCLEEKLE